MDAIGPYRLDALVGRGTAGSVWRATRSGPVAQVVAVKRARVAGVTDAAAKEATDRLRREAAILAELDHPHIVRILDVLPDGEGVAIVMSLARGGSLHDLLAERGRLTAGQTVAVLSRIADALGSAHRRGVCHGDVKPANILFTADGEPLLGDFGVAQHLTPGRAGLDGVAALRAVEGTAGYVDPELVATGRPDPRNDVYGLAVVAYLCLSGRLPHDGGDAGQILAAAEAGDHLDLADNPQVSPPLAALITSALSRDPALRPATADALAHALRAAVDPSAIVLPGRAVEVVDRRAAAAEVDPAAGPGLDADGIASGGPVVGSWGSPEASGARATRSFGPRPPRPQPVARRSRRLRTVLVVVTVLAIALGGGLWVGDRVGDRQAPGDVAVDAEGEPEGRACPALPALEVPAAAEVLSADLKGDGCPVEVVWDGQVMLYRVDRAEPAPRRLRFEVARGGGGQLVMGDWDCDGADTPAYYQPGTGAVSYFADLPEQVDGEVLSTQDDTDVVGGKAEVTTDDDGCDVVDVSPQA